MKIIRVFLASSSELKDDRKEFEIFIARENKSLIKNDVYLELVIWEDFIESMSKTRLQDEYKKAVLESDIFIMLFFTSVGKYTLEEFEQAFAQFKKTGKPFIYTFFKDVPVHFGRIKADDISNLLVFKDKLNSFGHFCETYDNVNSLKKQFSAELNKLQSMGYFKSIAEKDQGEYRKNKVFVSYSHRDKEFLQRLLVHLKPLEEEGLIEIWDDTKLDPGDEWEKAIEKNLKATGFAILLISADFLASDFIVKNELPPLLTAAKQRGTRITPIIIKPCRFTRDKNLGIYQAVNSPNKPLAGESEFEQEKIYDKVSEWIEVYFRDETS